MALVAVKELKDRLRGSAPVELRGAEYRVKPVSLLLFVDDPSEMWKAAREDKEKLDALLKASIANPSYDQMRRVLLKGTAHPRLVPSEPMETDGSLCVDTLLVDYELASELYLAIAKQSMEG